MLGKFGKSACARMLPTIVLSMGGRGGRSPVSRGEEKLLQLMERWGHWGCDGRTIFLFDGLYVSEKVWSPYDMNMLLDYFGGAEHNGALKIDQEGQYYGGVISTFSLLEMGTLWCPRPTRR